MRLLFLFLIMMVTSFALLAQVAVPDAEVSKELLNLFMNFKTLGPVGIGMSVVVVLTQLSKTEIFGKIFKKMEYKRLFVTVIGQIYGMLFMVQSGSSWLNAAFIGLLSSGGAVAIWEAVKPLVEKKPNQPL